MSSTCGSAPLSEQWPRRRRPPHTQDWLLRRGGPPLPPPPILLILQPAFQQELPPKGGYLCLGGAASRVVEARGYSRDPESDAWPNVAIEMQLVTLVSRARWVEAVDSWFRCSFCGLRRRRRRRLLLASSEGWTCSGRSQRRGRKGKSGKWLASKYDWFIGPGNASSLTSAPTRQMVPMVR